MSLRDAAAALLSAAIEADDRIAALEKQAAVDATELARLRQAVAPAPAPAKPPQSLLHWSTFSDGVTLAPPRDCYSAGCWQDVLGLDSVSGFLWPPKLAASSGFQMRSAAPSTPGNISDYIVNDFQPGRSGRALHQLIKKNPVTGMAGDLAGTSGTQDAYLLNPAKPQDDLYISFWRKLQPDLLAKLVNGWYVVFEWKTAGDYRVITQIVNYGGVAPYWETRADNNANGGLPFQKFWTVTNDKVPVPIGEWFKYEVFWHRSKGSDGRVWVAVNGKVIADKSGPNYGVHGEPIDRIFLMQLYSAAAYPLEQWTDDVQIWSGFPDVKKGDPWNDGVYAPH